MARTNDKIQAVIFRRLEGNPEFLILHRIPKKSGTWQSVTGAIENDESEENALKREIFEETGIKASDILDYSKIMEFEFGREKNLRHENVFSVEVKPDVRITDENNVYREHDEWMWCREDEAMSLVRWKNNKEAIKKTAEKCRDKKD